jgi:homoserine kinase type II
MGKPAALFPWQPGGMRCQAAVTPHDAAEVGAALARVHGAGEGAQRSAGRFREVDLFVRLDRIAATDDPSLALHASPLRARLARWSGARDPSLPRGLVHGDLFRDNVLWDDKGGIVALLDFESASEGVFAYDLVVTLLAWCVGDRLDPALARAMAAGYESVRPLTGAERAGLLAEACMAALRFTITRITDYAMRAGVGPRVTKDYRRFLMRLDALEAMGQSGLADALGL